MRFRYEADFCRKESPHFCLEYKEGKKSDEQFVEFFIDYLESKGCECSILGGCGKDDVMSLYVDLKRPIYYGDYSEAWEEAKDLYRDAKRKFALSLR